MSRAESSHECSSLEERQREKQRQRQQIGSRQKHRQTDRQTDRQLRQQRQYKLVHSLTVHKRCSHVTSYGERCTTPQQEQPLLRAVNRHPMPTQTFHIARLHMVCKDISDRAHATTILYSCAVSALVLCWCGCCCSCVLLCCAAIFFYVLMLLICVLLTAVFFSSVCLTVVAFPFPVLTSAICPSNPSVIS